MARSNHALDRVTFMPLRLSAILTDYRITREQLGAAISQLNGNGLNKSTVSLWLNWNRWPTKTPRHSIEQQTRDFLRSRGVPETLIERCFDLDETASEAGPDAVRRFTKPAAKALPSKDELILEPTMLTTAARRHFQITIDPFACNPNGPDDVFMGPEQKYVVSSLLEAIRHTRMLALVGESGSGKTTLYDLVCDRIRGEGMPIHILQPMMTDKEKLTGTGVLQSIVRDLDPKVTVATRPEMLARQAHELIAQRVGDGQQCVLIFEEGHDLNVDTIKQLKRFHEFKAGWKRLLSIVLVAQPELLHKLEARGNTVREVKNRLDVVRLLPLDRDLEAYFDHRLKAFGRRREDLFTDDAMEAFRTVLVATGSDRKEVPMTYPLLVNILATRCLNEAAEVGAAKVDRNVVLSARRRDE